MPRNCKKAKEKKKKLRIRNILNHLGESDSESSAGDAGSDDDDVDVAVTGSTFSVSGGGDALHALASRLRRNSDTVLLGHQSINRQKPQHRGQYPPKQALIHHFFFQCQPARAHHKLPGVSLAVISLLAWFSASCNCAVILSPRWLCLFFFSFLFSSSTKRLFVTLLWEISGQRARFYIGQADELQLNSNVSMLVCAGSAFWLKLRTTRFANLSSFSSFSHIWVLTTLSNVTFALICYIYFISVYLFMF